MGNYIKSFYKRFKNIIDQAFELKKNMKNHFKLIKVHLNP